MPQPQNVPGDAETARRQRLIAEEEARRAEADEKGADELD